MSILEQDGERAWDIMEWDVLGGGAPWPTTNVRNLGLSQWRALAAHPAKRCRRCQSNVQAGGAVISITDAAQVERPSA